MFPIQHSLRSWARADVINDVLPHYQFVVVNYILLRSSRTQPEVSEELPSLTVNGRYELRRPGP
jgi:hypothetical protein